MKTKMIAPMLLAALFIGTSCSKDSVVEEVEKPMEETKTVLVKFSMPDSPLTRVNDLPASATSTRIHDAGIYLADADDKILRKYDVASSEIAAGVKLAGVPISATKMYMYANKTASGMGAYPVPTTDLDLDGLKKLLVNIPVKGQTTTPTLTGTTVTSADKAIMDGSATLTKEATTVTVALSPIVARMEIDTIRVSGVSPTGLLISGVFINNFYNKFNASGVGSDFKKIIDASKFIGTYPGGSGAENQSYLNNWYNDTKGFALNSQNSLTATPSVRVLTSKTWAFQVFPATNGDDVTLDSLPHIVVKLENVAVTGQPTKAVQFVTVKKYKDAIGASIKSFVRGNVYRIAKIEFAYKDLSDKPEEVNKEVTATITVNPWTLNDIVPDL